MKAKNVENFIFKRLRAGRKNFYHFLIGKEVFPPIAVPSWAVTSLIKQLTMVT